MTCDKKGIGLKVKDGNSRCYSDREVKKSGVKRTRKRKWTEKWTARRSETSAKRKTMKQLRKADDFADLSPQFFAEQKEKWRQELQNIEQRRNDLLPRGIRSCRVCMREKQQCQRVWASGLRRMTNSEPALKSKWLKM